MFRFLFLIVLCSPLFALDISLYGAKENFQTYSTLHIKDKEKFLCQEIKDDFENVTKIVCAFSKSPLEKLKPIKNDFFKVDNQVKGKTFFIIITPFQKIKLYPVIFKLYEEDSIYTANVKLAKHWMIVGYKQKVPYIENIKHSDMSLNFPFFMQDDKIPFVGSLDIKGNPVYIEEVGDVSGYLKIKKYYKEKKYERCLEMIDDLLDEYPNSLFSAELLYYKIKVSSELENYDDVIEYSKTFLREYSADDNIAEVLALSARAYYLNGLNSQADYFFDRLFDEHKDSKYCKWGYIYKGEMLEDSGAFSRAVKYYKKALMETKDIDVAADAAFKLALYYASNAKMKDATEYVMKILKAQPGFFVKKYKESLELMRNLADAQQYFTAASIAQALLEKINMDYDEYESILKNRAIWLCKTQYKDEALKALNRYLKEFPDGMYYDEVQMAKDGLFFDMKDENLTQKLANYDTLIEKYNTDTIGQRAVYEKAKLMLKNKMYNEVLKFKASILALDEDKYPDIKEIIDDAAYGAMQEALKNRECRDVLDISSEYDLVLSDKWDDGIYECAMKGADFLLAKKIADKNLKSKDLQIRKKWLYRYIKIDFATGNYSDVVKASNDLISLMDVDKDFRYKDVYRILFDTYQRLENSDKMIEIMGKIESLYGLDYKDIDRYVAMVSIGAKRKDDNIIIEYAQKVMKLQKKSDSYPQSPYIEFTLYQAYINKSDYKQALDTIKSLDNIKLSKEQRARQKYLLGSVYEKLWMDAKAQKAYDESLKAAPDSAWAKLAKDAKEQ